MLTVHHWFRSTVLQLYDILDADEEEGLEEVFQLELCANLLPLTLMPGDLYGELVLNLRPKMRVCGTIVFNSRTEVD